MKLATSGKRTRLLLTKEQIVYLQLEVEGVGLLPLCAQRRVAESVERSPRAYAAMVGNGQALFVIVKPAHKKV